jgi:hypothetical protein
MNPGRRTYPLFWKASRTASSALFLPLKYLHSAWATTAKNALWVKDCSTVAHLLLADCGVAVRNASATYPFNTNSGKSLRMEEIYTNRETPTNNTKNRIRMHRGIEIKRSYLVSSSPALRASLAARMFPSPLILSINLFDERK